MGECPDIRERMAQEEEVVIISGKGGTGKTSIVGSFAVIGRNKVLCDCDVDAADLHLILQPQIKENHEFRSGQTALINRDKCTECGLCEQECRFDAIHNFAVDDASCEGCGLCSHICAAGAITMRDNLSGHWFISGTKHGSLVHARLGIAEENSGKLVTTVREEAKRIAGEQDLEYVITDGPPGTGCPVISSLSGANLALIVNEENTEHIKSQCRELGVPLAAKIPFDNIVTEALVHGLPVVEYSEGDVTWVTISAIIK